MQDGGLAVQPLAPFVDGSLARVAQAGWVPAVPVDAMLEVHVETYQDDARGPELDRQIQGVKAAVSAPAYFPREVENQLMEL